MLRIPTTNRRLAVALGVILCGGLGPLIAQDGSTDPTPSTTAPSTTAPSTTAPSTTAPSTTAPQDANPGAPGSPVRGDEDAALSLEEIPAHSSPIPWRKSWRSAEAEARERNVPILIVVHRDGDRISDATRASLWTNREFQELVDNECVPVLISLPPSNGEAPHVEIPANQGTGTPAHCPLTPTLRCADHEAMALRVKPEWRAGDGPLPERRLVSVDGKVIVEPQELPPGMAPLHLRRVLPQVREALGERRATRVQYRFALVRLDRMEESLYTREFKSASLDLKAFRRDQEVLPAPLRARADEAEKKIRAEAQRFLERARSFEETRPRAAGQLYKVVLDQFPGVPEGETARKKLEELAKSTRKDG